MSESHPRAIWQHRCIAEGTAVTGTSGA